MTSDELRDKLCADNVSWQDRALVILEYHEEQCKTHDTPVSKFKKKGWTLKDTASILGVSYSLVFWELRLGEALRNGKLQDARSKNHAIFLLERDAGTKVQLKYARTLITGTLLTTTKFNGTEICIIKLSSPIRTQHVDIDMLAVPRYQCQFFRD